MYKYIYIINIYVINEMIIKYIKFSSSRRGKQLKTQVDIQPFYSWMLITGK